MPLQAPVAAATRRHHRLQVRPQQKISRFGADGVVVPDAHSTNDINTDRLGTRPAGHADKVARTHRGDDNRLIQSRKLCLDGDGVIAGQLAPVEREGFVVLALLVKGLLELVSVGIRVSSGSSLCSGGLSCIKFFRVNDGVHAG